MSYNPPRILRVITVFVVAALLFSCSSPASTSHMHSIVIDEMVSATCYSTGLTAGSHCSVCGEVIQAQEVIPLSPHSIVVDQMVDSTCTSTGLTKGSHCSVCGKVFEQQEIIPFSDHQLVVDESVAATCHSAGLTEGSHCSVCGYVAKQQQPIPVAAHTVGEIITDNPATCTESGKLVYNCSMCGEEQTRIIPATGHKATKATCTEDGKCTICGETVEKALGHVGSFGDTCTRCGMIIGPRLKTASTPFYVAEYYNPSKVRSEVRFDRIYVSSIYYDGRNSMFRLYITIEGQFTYTDTDNQVTNFQTLLLNEKGKLVNGYDSARDARYDMKYKVGDCFSVTMSYMVSIAYADPSRFLEVKILSPGANWEAYK